jgi:ATP-dependent DNA ligase
MREMAVVADSEMFVYHMEPTLVLRIHHVAVVASGRFVPQIGWRVRYPAENDECEQKCGYPDCEHPF